MLQRIQSLLLLVTAIIHLALFLIPVFSWNSPTGENITLTALSNPPFIGLNAVVILFSIFIISQFKNRKKQRLYTLTLGFIIVAEILLYTLYMVRITLVNQYTLLPTSSFGIFLLLVGLILTFWAAKRIKKDDDLVKSIDRIR